MYRFNADQADTRQMTGTDEANVGQRARGAWHSAQDAERCVSGATPCDADRPQATGSATKTHVKMRPLCAPVPFDTMLGDKQLPELNWQSN